MGVNYDSQTDLVIKNCYNTGKITGSKESAGISGWLGWQTASAIVENCYNTGQVTGLDNNQTFARFGTSSGVIKLSNCYETIGSQVTYISSDEVANGKLCYMLNNSQSENPIWYQTLGKDNYPIFDPTHGIVYYNETNNLYTNQALTGIAEIMADQNVAGIYSIDGKRLSRPQRGLNIIRMKDGTVKRVMVK